MNQHGSLSTRLRSKRIYRESQAHRRLVALSQRAKIPLRLQVGAAEQRFDQYRQNKRDEFKQPEYLRYVATQTWVGRQKSKFSEARWVNYVGGMSNERRRVARRGGAAALRQRLLTELAKERMETYEWLDCVASFNVLCLRSSADVLLYEQMILGVMRFADSLTFDATYYSYHWLRRAATIGKRLDERVVLEVVSFLGRRGLLKAAGNAFNTLFDVRARRTPSEAAYCSAIMVLAGADAQREAEQLFEQACAEPVALHNSNVLWTTWICALAVLTSDAPLQTADKAFALLATMRTRGLPASGTTLRAVMECLINARQYRRAIELFESSASFGVREPTPEMRVSLLQARMSEPSDTNVDEVRDEALQLAREQLLPQPLIDAVLTLLSAQRSVDEALAFAAQLHSLGVDGSHRVWRSLFYDACRSWDADQHLVEGVRVLAACPAGAHVPGLIDALLGVLAQLQEEDEPRARAVELQTLTDNEPVVKRLLSLGMRRARDANPVPLAWQGAFYLVELCLHIKADGERLPTITAEHLELATQELMHSGETVRCERLLRRSHAAQAVFDDNQLQRLLLMVAVARAALGDTTRVADVLRDATVGRQRACHASVINYMSEWLAHRGDAHSARFINNMACTELGVERSALQWAPVVSALCCEGRGESALQIAAEARSDGAPPMYEQLMHAPMLHPHIALAAYFDAQSDAHARVSLDMHTWALRLAELTTHSLPLALGAFQALRKANAPLQRDHYTALLRVAIGDATQTSYALKCAATDAGLSDDDRRWLRDYAQEVRSDWPVPHYKRLPFATAPRRPAQSLSSFLSSIRTLVGGEKQ